MNNQKREQAPPGAIPSIIEPLEYVCILPAKGLPASAPKRPAAPPEPKPEPTMEQRIADEVERRVNNQVGNFFIGYIIGECLGSLFHKHHED